MNRRWRVLFANKTAMFGGGLIVLFLLVAIFANVIATHDPEQRQDDLLAPPSSEYWLGTDQNGFDVFSRLVFGTRSKAPRHKSIRYGRACDHSRLRLE